jgi:type IV secretion system protein VirD4
VNTQAKLDDWSHLPPPPKVKVAEPDKETKPGDGKKPAKAKVETDPANAGIRREPDLPDHEEVVPTKAAPPPEFAFPEESDEDDAARANALRRQMSGLARQASLDPADDLGL